MAWSISAIYWEVKGQVFHVDPGSLAFSVTLFTIFAFINIGVLMLRRRPSVGGELGGPKTLKILTSLLFLGLWLLYITFSSLEAYCHITGFWGEREKDKTTRLILALMAFAWNELSENWALREIHNTVYSMVICCRYHILYKQTHLKQKIEWERARLYDCTAVRDVFDCCSSLVSKHIRGIMNFWHHKTLSGMEDL